MKKAITLFTLLVLVLSSAQLFAQDKEESAKEAAKTTEQAVEKAIELGDVATQISEMEAKAAAAKTYSVPKFEVIPASITVDEEEQEAFSITLPDVEMKQVGKKWKRHLKKAKGGDLEEDNGRYSLTGAKIKDLTKGEMDIHSQLKVNNEGVEIVSSYVLEGALVTEESNPDKAKIIRKRLNDFALIFEKERVEDEYKAENSLLKGFNGELKKLGNKKEKYEKEIEKYKKMIAENEANIKTNVAAQDDLGKVIDAQEKVVKHSKNKVGLFK